jgi:hypothetical protein
MHNPYAMAAFVVVRTNGLEPFSLEWHSKAQPIYHVRERRPGIEPDQWLICSQQCSHFTSASNW